jgi:aspartate aminotransferase
MAISKEIAESMKSSSWIRAMFEEGEKMKKLYGAENVFDFSLGNPIEEPPELLKRELQRMVSSDVKGMHRYMSNGGYEEVRADIGLFHRDKTGLPFTLDNIIMTVGAAGGLNVVMKSLLDPGDEVIVPRPFFVEFKFYIENHRGVMRLVDMRDDFHLDLGKIAAAITPKTKAILINTPHNPTGIVYAHQELRDLAALLKELRKQGQSIVLVSDEAYRKLIYDGIDFPDIFNLYEDTISVTSHSKDLGLAGERIGYIAVSPLLESARAFVDAAIFANRILGFINAPAMMQRLSAKFQRNSVDIVDYQKKRDLIYGILEQAGFDVVKPMGAFYIFPKSPIPDDVEFVRALLRHHILTVPGVGFGTPGYFRIAYCVDTEVIEKSRPYFKEVAEDFSRGR